MSLYVQYLFIKKFQNTTIIIAITLPIKSDICAILTAINIIARCNTSPSALTIKKEKSSI